MSQTNDLTRFILSDLFQRGIFAWRNNTTGIYDAQKHIFRTAAKKGVSDILACVPPQGRLLAIEIKTGSDRLSAEQIGYKRNVEHVGGIAIVVKDENDYLEAIIAHKL